MCGRIDNAVYEGFLLFVGYAQEKKEQVDIAIATKENLISLLDNSLHYLSLLSEIDYKEYKEKISALTEDNINMKKREEEDKFQIENLTKEVEKKKKEANKLPK